MTKMSFNRGKFEVHAQQGQETPTYHKIIKSKPILST